MQWDLCVLYAISIFRQKLIRQESKVCHYGFGIVNNPKSIIGKGIVIQHSAAIGERGGSHLPVLGEDVFIKARAMYQRGR